MTSRRYVFTLNFDNNLPNLSDMFEEHADRIRYAVWQHERVNHDHIQGYIVLKKAERITGVRNIFGDLRPHFEKAQGTHDQCKEYCTKEESRIEGPWEFGEEKNCGQGKRNDLNELKRKLDEGKSELEIADEMFGTWARHYKAIERYKLLKSTPRSKPTEVEMHIGATGTGKSRSVTLRFPDAFWVARAQGTAWYDGYQDHAVAVFDDFYGWIPYDMLLRITDSTPLRVQTKGGFVNWKPERVIFTSNKTPAIWYKKIFESGEVCPKAFLRRVTRWVAYHPGGVVYDGPDFEAFSAALAMVPGDIHAVPVEFGAVHAEDHEVIELE